MAEPSPVDDEQERRRLFQAVWGDAPQQAFRPRPRPLQREDDMAAPDAGFATAPADRIEELEREVRRLQEGIEALQRMTEAGFDEIRNAMLRLADTVEASPRKAVPTKKSRTTTRKGPTTTEPTAPDRET